MSDKLKKGGGRLDEGTVRKGGVNPEYQITQRPPPPAPMKPPVPPPPSTNQPKKG